MIRLVIGLVISVLFFIFVIQNLKTVELNFLLWRFNGSLALILILTFIIAIIFSLLLAIPLYIKRNKKTEVKELKKVEETKT